MTDDQDLYDWKHNRNRKAAKQLSDRLKQRQREETYEILVRYADRQVDDLEPPPRID